MKKILSILLTYLLTITSAQVFATDVPSSTSNTQNVKRGVVMISDKLIAAIYSANSGKEHEGTGFIIDKKQGLIVTNEHIATKHRISEFKITFYNGREVSAKHLYSDPWVDFSFLKVDPEDIPDNAIELTLSSSSVHNEEEVLIIGNNQGNNYSIQTGTVSNPYSIIGLFPFQVITLSINAKGGSSGSPVINEKGEVVALNFAASDTAAYAIPIAYIKDALDSIKKNQIPSRKEIGAFVEYASLDKISKFTPFPKGFINSYVNQFPDAFNNVIRVTSVFDDSPAFGLLQSGDIIWKINSTQIGPDLYRYQKNMNLTLGESVSIDFYRNGKLENVQIHPYDLHPLTPKKVVIFGGATFLEVDDYLKLITGAPKGKVFITNIVQGSSFDGSELMPWMNMDNYGIIYLINLVSVEGKPINSLEDLIEIIPTVIKKEDFKIKIKNYGFHEAFGGTPLFNRNEMEVGIKYNSPDSEPTVIYFDDKRLDWVSEKIITRENTKKD